MPGSVTSDEGDNDDPPKKDRDDNEDGDDEDGPPDDEEEATDYWIAKLVASGRYSRVKLLAKGGMGAAFSVTRLDDLSRRAVKLSLPSFEDYFQEARLGCFSLIISHCSETTAAAGDQYDGCAPSPELSASVLFWIYGQIMLL